MQGCNIQGSIHNLLDDAREPHAFNDKDEIRHLLSEAHMPAGPHTVNRSLLSQAITPNETAGGKLGAVDLDTKKELSIGKGAVRSLPARYQPLLWRA